MQNTKQNTKTILFTGGGSAGHVTPNLALIEKCKANAWQVVYVGSATGIEKTIINEAGIDFYAIASGKLRRYFSWQNFLDPFKVVWGVGQAFLLCRRLKPALIFSKGGFVAFPVVVAGWLNRIPVIVHESDLTPGLANRLSYPFANIICLTFAVSVNYFKQPQKLLVTGTPLRNALFLGDANIGRSLCGFNSAKKVLLIFGGGLGAESINQVVRALLPELLTEYQIIHLCGKGKLDSNLQNKVGYVQFEYVSEELPHFLASADLVVSRAGANSIYELLALKKPHILIPLSKRASRGDQIVNAKYFADLGLSQVLYEEELTTNKLLEKIQWMNMRQGEIAQALQHYQPLDSVQLIYEKIVGLACAQK